MNFEILKIMSTTKSPRKKKTKKDPLAPKAAGTAFSFFSRDFRAENKETYAGLTFGSYVKNFYIILIYYYIVLIT